MKAKRIYLIIALTIAVATVLINVGYAVTSSVRVDNNSISAEERSVDIFINDSPLSDAISVTPPAYEDLNDPQDNPYTITGHKLRISASSDVRVRAWIYLDDPADWLIVDHITLSINSHSYTFGISEIDPPTGGASERYSSFEPTDAFTLSPDVSYTFSISIYFKGDVGEDIYDQLSANLSGRLTFAVADANPIPGQ